MTLQYHMGAEVAPQNYLKAWTEFTYFPSADSLSPAKLHADLEMWTV